MKIERLLRETRGAFLIYINIFFTTSQNKIQIRVLFVYVYDINITYNIKINILYI